MPLFGRLRTDRSFSRAFCGGVVLSLALLSAIPFASFDNVSALAMTGDANAAGMRLFQAKDYLRAAGAFRAAIRQNPNDPNRYYYYALSLHYAKLTSEAKAAYLEVMSRFPNSQSAAYAQTALARLDPNLLKQVAASPRVQQFGGSHSSGGSSSSVSSYTSSSNDTIPASASVNFVNENNHMVIDVLFNGRPCKAIFDTGAESILMGKNHLRELGLPLPTAPATNQSRGVDGTLVDLQEDRMDVTVGGVTRRNIVVHVMDNMASLPLLGLPFVKGMNYSVDNNTIRFTAKASPSSTAGRSSSRGTDYNSVPFTSDGRNIVVQVNVNGHTIPMCLDTGASETIFNQQQAAAAGLTVSEDAETRTASGAGGAVLIRYTVAQSMRLGPVDRRDLRVAVNLASHSPYPLLGRDFFGDRRFSVDNDNNLIHFN